MSTYAPLSSDASEQPNEQNLDTDAEKPTDAEQPKISTEEPNGEVEQPKGPSVAALSNRFGDKAAFGVGPSRGSITGRGFPVPRPSQYAAQTGAGVEAKPARLPEPRFQAAAAPAPAAAPAAAAEVDTEARPALLSEWLASVTKTCDAAKETLASGLSALRPKSKEVDADASAKLLADTTDPAAPLSAFKRQQTFGTPTATKIPVSMSVRVRRTFDLNLVRQEFGLNLHILLEWESDEEVPDLLKAQPAAAGFRWEPEWKPR